MKSIHKLARRCVKRPVLVAGILFLSVPVMAWYIAGGARQQPPQSMVADPEPVARAQDRQPAGQAAAETLPGQQATIAAVDMVEMAGDTSVATEDKPAAVDIQWEPTATPTIGLQPIPDYDMRAAAVSGNLHISNIGNEIIISRTQPDRAAHAVASQDKNAVLDNPENKPTDTGTDTDNNVLPADEPVWITSNCPNELPPGSTGTYADYMQQTYGCRYMSACYVGYPPGNNPCTYYFRGFAS